MRCTRCAGMQVPDIISEGGERTIVLRCVTCGDIVDRVIVRNRRRRQPPQPRRPRTPLYAADWERRRAAVI